MNGAALAKEARCWTIANSDPEIYNQPDQELFIGINEQTLSLDEPILEAPAYGIVLYRMELQ